MNATLKCYEPSMQPAVEALYRECFGALGWEYEPGGRHSDLVNIPAVYQEGGQFWCLYDGDELVGTVAVCALALGEAGQAGKTAELKRLYVSPARQGEGFGGLLFDAALKFAREAGFEKMYADTRRDRSASQHLMRKNGFREIRQYNDNDFAELFFELDLSD